MLPFDVKRLKAVLRRRGIGRLEIKVRGVDAEPRQLIRRLRVPGDQSATVLVTRRDDKALAILAKREYG